LIKRATEFAHDHVARQAQLSEDLTRRTHHVGQILRRYYDQGHRKDYYDFDYAQVLTLSGKTPDAHAAMPEFRCKSSV
jgi:hypothetical protein